MIEGMATGPVTGGSIFINLQERKATRMNPTKERPRSQLEEGKPFDQFLEI